MPELPEVETTLRGIEPHLVGKKCLGMRISHYRLRWPIIPNLSDIVAGQTLHKIERRAKYLLFSLDHGSLIIHLGMSGRLTILKMSQPAGQHDHCDFIFSEHCFLRYHDPRRFGAILWTDQPVIQHPLLKNLGLEPLTSHFTALYLQHCCQHKKVSIKSILMDSHLVVGIGNIYANEALFLSGIHPAQAGYALDLTALTRLTKAIKYVLKKAIRAGGTSLKDFLNADGNPGYFKQSLQVYGKKNQPCPQCQQPIQLLYQQKRSSYFCAKCQRMR